MLLSLGSAYGTRTRVPGVRGRYPRPLDESAIVFICLKKLQRKLGDSNPRYGNPYGSLANCWFQPLTQTSSGETVVAILKRAQR